MSSATNNVYMKVDDQFIRLEQHACSCDQCLVMDRVDEEVIEVTKQYLSESISLDAWWDKTNMMQVTNTPKLHHAHRGFDEGPITILDSIAMTMWMRYQPDPDGYRELTSERELRIALGCLLEGYEVRQRSVHKWKLVRPAPKAEEKKKP